MFGLGLWELVVILVVILIVFGAGKLPKVMNDLGKGAAQFKAGLAEGEQKKNAEPKE